MQRKVNTQNPSQSDLKVIQLVQKKQWQEVQAKTKWSQADFESALYSGMIWESDSKEWIYSMSHLEKLAFDSRTPKPMAKKLTEVLKASKKKTF